MYCCLDSLPALLRGPHGSNSSMQNRLNSRVSCPRLRLQPLERRARLQPLERPVRLQPLERLVRLQPLERQEHLDGSPGLRPTWYPRGAF